MPNCKDMTRLLSDGLDGKLSWRQRWAMHLHLLYCGMCRRYRQHLLFMQKALLQLDTQNPNLKLSTRVKQQIKDNLAKQIGQTKK